jgi:hypothetical protein
MRPYPPEDFIEVSYRPGRPDFIVAHELMIWATSSFIDSEGEYANPDHAHLQNASLGFLWTRVPNGRAMRRIVGTCELGTPRAMGKWQKARAEQQIREWFGHVPDFILTFDANYAAQCDDAEFCALVEHELYHAGQERDEFGAPKFKRSGLPAFAMRGHDCEEFVGVVRRYGAAAAGVEELVRAAAHPPEMGRANVGHLCGTCQLKAA